MRAGVSGFFIGLLFGLGLVISMMMNPLKVLSFLDLAGAWDPSLALVMAAALAVTLVGYRLVLARERPLFAERFVLPTRTALDGRLFAGSGLFGVGWGLVGFCPGPAVTALGTGDTRVFAFVAAMLLGMALARAAMLRADPARV